MSDTPQNVYLQHESGLLGMTGDARVAEEMERTGWKRLSRYVWRKLAKQQGRGLAHDAKANGESADETQENA